MKLTQLIRELKARVSFDDPDIEAVVMIDGLPFEIEVDDNEDPVILSLAYRDGNGVITSWIGNKAVVTATLLTDETVEYIEAKAEADRINSDPRLLDAYNELVDLEQKYAVNGPVFRAESSERMEQLRAILGEERADPSEPRCDICGRRMDDSPAGFADADWNPETGNHETCEIGFDSTDFAQVVSDTINRNLAL